MSDISMNEQFISKKMEKDAAAYLRSYNDVITDAHDAFNEVYKGNREWSDYDTVALGEYLNNWNNYKEIFESDPTTRDSLGKYLEVGMGLVAMQYVALPASFFASIQPLDDEVGSIYYRELVATATRGDITTGDVIGSQEGKLSATLDTYYGEQVTSTTTVVKDTGTYSISLGAPVRPRSLVITVSKIVSGTTTSYSGVDDGNGNIYGNWPVDAAAAVTGTVTYSSGAVVINFDDSAAGLTGGSITIVYHQNLVQASTIPGFKYQLTSKSTRVNYYVLTDEYSTIADFVVRKRFGTALVDDIAASAVSQINSSVLTTMIKQLKAAAAITGTATWSGTTPDGVSVADHRKTFTDSFEAAAQLMDARTGRGAISFIIAGSYGRRILQSIGVALDRKPIPGPYLAGFYGRIPVFYAPATLVADADLIVGYRGSAWFEAPIVYAPFLPIVTVSGTSSGNPFNRINGTAHAAAVETVVPGFCAKISITGM